MLHKLLLSPDDLYFIPANLSDPFITITSATTVHTDQDPRYRKMSAAHPRPNSLDRTQSGDSRLTASNLVVINRDPIKYLNPSTDILVCVDITSKSGDNIQTTLRMPELPLGAFLNPATFANPTLLGRQFQTGGQPTLVTSPTRGIILPFQLRIHLYDDPETLTKLNLAISQLLTRPESGTTSFSIYDQTTVHVRFHPDFLAKLSVFYTIKP